MLYDVLPPTVFFASLGGIVVLLSRVMVRVRREVVTASVHTARVQSRSPRALLKPDQKGVQESGSRWQLFATGVRETVGQAESGVRSVQERWQQKKDEGAAEEQEVEEPQANSLRQSTENVKDRFKRFSRQAGEAGQGRANRLRGGFERWRARRAIAKSAEEELAESSVQEDDELRVDSGHANQQEPSPAMHVAVKKPTGSGGVTTRVVLQDETAASDSAPVKRTGLGRSKAPVPASPLAEVHEAIGAEDYQKAEELLIEHIADHTKDTKAYLLLGKVCLEREEWSEAMEVFAQVVKLKPGSPEAYSGLGSAAFKAGKYTQALQALQRAHEADPSNREVLEQLLIIAQRMDNPALQHSISEKISRLVEA